METFTTQTTKLAGECIVCFAGEDWWYHNPHSNLHIMKSLAKDNRILFVNSIGIRMPSLMKDRFAAKKIAGKIKSLLRYLKKAEPNIYVLTPIALPIFSKGKRLINRINCVLMVAQLRCVLWALKFKKPILWVTLPSVRDTVFALRKHSAKCLVYYCVDNISFFEGADQRYIADLDRDLHKQADVAFFVNHQLAEERKKHNPRTFFLSHGVDFDHFADLKNKTLPMPEDFLELKRPIVGYMGLIRDLDFDLIKYLAGRNPNCSFVFIGENYSALEAIDGLPNVYFLGKKDYAILPQYLKFFDVCCLYYRTGDGFNDYRNPKKLLEYLATGIPVVSVSILELTHYKDLILIAKTYEEFDQHLKSVLQNKTTAAKEIQIDFARRHTWDDVAEKACVPIISYLRENISAGG